jgi:hypothetical protein
MKNILLTGLFFFSSKLDKLKKIGLELLQIGNYFDIMSFITVNQKIKFARKSLVYILTFSVGIVNAANIFSTPTGGNWSAPSTWVGGVVPTSIDNVTVVAGSSIVLDVDITIGVNNTYTFNGNVTDNGTHTLTAIQSGSNLIISNNSTTTIGGAVSWDNSTIIVNAGSTLIVGPLTIGNGTTINIAGSLFVNGNVLDNNNGGGSFSVTGFVQVYGNYTSPVGSVSVSGSGIFQTTGTIITTGSSTVGGSTNNCTTGPCSSGSIGCGPGGPSSYTSSVSPTNQVLCTGQTIALIQFISNVTGTLTYQWQVSTTNGGTGFADIVGATTTSYTPSQPSVTTWYRMKYSSTTSGCSNLISPSSQISYSTPTASVTIQPTCTTPTGTIVITAPAPGANVTYTVTGTAPVVAAVTQATTTFATLTPGTYSVITTNTSTSCVSAATSLTVNAIPANPIAPTASVTVQSSCTTPTGTILVTAPVPAANITYTVTGTAPAVAAVTQATTTFTTLTPGDYSVITTNTTTGCVSALISLTVNAASTIYSGSWSNGVPDVLKKAIFASNYTLSGNLTACSCQVNTGVNVTVDPGFSLVLENGLDVVGTGSITFQNNSSLIQTNNTAINTGNITYKRKTTPIEKFDYTYWSSPVANQQLVNVSPTTLADKYYSFDPLINDWYLEAPTNTMTNGIGYIIRGPQAYLTPTIYEASFIGIPNNGNITNNTTGIGLTYLFGNPYPSAIDADLFLNLNNNVLEGTIYFWTHNTPITNNKYTADDYASYNIIGGTGTTAISTGINNSIPTGKIAAGQSFMTTSSGIGTVTFNNSLRILGMNTQFFRLIDSSKTKTTLKKNRIWLNLTNSEGAFKQTLIGYVTGAINGLDNRFDGETFDANQYVDFYSINLGKNLVIQGRALPFNRTDTVPLGYRTTVAGNFSIKIDQLDGLFTTHNIYIEDKNTGIIHDLKKEAYVFTTAIGTYNDRFVLKYTENPLPPKGNIKHPNYVIVTNQNNKIKIYSSEENIDKVIIYDITGKQIYKITNVNDDQLAIENLASSQQILVLKIVLKNKKIVTKKIFY